MLATLMPFYILLVVLINPISASQELSLLVHADRDDYDSYVLKLQELVPEPLPIKKVSFKADIFFQKAEFDYLTGMQEGSSVSYKNIAQALYFLFKKQKFESILVTMVMHDDGLDLHFELSSFWTLHKVKLQGIFVGKEYYRQSYIMESGDRFDEQKHIDSVEKIIDFLKKEGYFDAQVDVDLIRDQRTKSITVCLNLKKGSRFAIGSVDVVFNSLLLTDNQKELLRNDIQEPFVQPLLKTWYKLKRWYNRELINSQTGLLKDFLIKHKNLQVDIELNETVHYKTRQVDLVFIIQAHFKRTFHFVGNQYYSREQLLDFILAFGRSSSLLPASILSEEIVKAYQDKGFWSVAIETQEKNDAYYFVIEEGPRAHIVDVELRNLSCFNDRYLIKRFFTSILKKKQYDSCVLDRAIESTLSYFLTLGFWQSSFLRKSFELIDPVNNGYKLILTFDEGVQNFLKGIKIAGFEHLESQGPFKQFYQQTKSVPFDLAIIDEQRQWLQHHFQKEGYYQPKIKPLFDKQQGDIYVTWQIDLNVAQFEFGKTILLGATRFPFDYIRRELAYAIGDPWHTNAVRNSISRLQKLEIFESIQLFPDKEIDGKEHLMLLKLQQDDPFELKMRAGLGLQHVTKSLTTGGLTYRIGGSFIWKNPSNNADQLRLDADFTKAIRLVNAQYRLPWMFNVPINGMLQGYSNRFEYPGFIGSQKNLYTVIQQGCLLNLTSVYKVIDAALSTGFEVIDTFIDDSDENNCFSQQVARAINFQPELLDKNIPFFLMQPTFILFFLDSTINPTRGSFSVLSAKGMFPMAKLAPHNFFIRILLEQSFFIPCRPLVFALRFRVGHIFHPKFSTIIPIERFYLGGANSIRSYETDQCPPLGIVCDNDKELFVPQGGRSLVNLNLEMRFPLYRQFNGVIFGDIGALSTNRLAEIRAKDLLSGIGFGLRYNTVIGPLRFDVAWRGHKHDGVGRPYAWFLSFGNAFI